MSPEFALPNENGGTPGQARPRAWRIVGAAASVCVGLTAFASLAPARLQDPAPADAPDDTKAKAKAKPATKKATAAPVDEAPATAEPAPEVQRKAEIPPPAGFSQVPRTPSELWEVVDYLIRSRQPEQAVPYIRQFLALQPDDAAYLRLREEFGMGAFFRLGDADITRPYLKPIIDRLNAAVVKHTYDPARISRHVAALTKSEDERRHAIAELHSAGSVAVPVILQAARAASGKDKASIIEALGRLDRNAIPALVATLESKDEAEVKAAANALARIGDLQALPDLIRVASRPRSAASSAANEAVIGLTGLPIGAREAPSEVLAQAARRYYLGQVAMPDPATVWEWDESAQLPVSRSLPRVEALSLQGSKLARAALSLDPSDLAAQKTLVALTLDRTAKGSPPPASVLAAGADLLNAVTRQAITDHRPDLAVKAIAALAKVSDRNTLGTSPGSKALVEALGAPDRRVQLAAAEAIVGLDPTVGFPGSSRVVPVLARFAANPRQHAAIVIDGNSPRASQVASALHGIGYDAQVATKGEEGFRHAAGAANVELVVIDPTYLAGAWTWKDTLSNLRADARTAGLPIFLIGPISTEDRYAPKVEGYSGVHFLVSPTDANLFKGQIDRALQKQGVMPLTEPERAAFAIRASQLLTKIAQSKQSPFTSDLAAVEPNLVLALHHTATAEAAALALGDIPGHDAQRSLANTLLEATRPLPARLKAAEALAHSLRRFGPLLTAEQEVLLVTSLENETDPKLRTAIATVVGALKPKPAAVGRMLRSDRLPTRTE